MNMQQTIEDKIRANISNVIKISLVNESAKHVGHLESDDDNSNSHFNLLVVSNDFIGKSALSRHQFLNGILKDEISKIHALSMMLLTEEEFKNKFGYK